MTSRRRERPDWHSDLLGVQVGAQNIGKYTGTLIYLDESSPSIERAIDLRDRLNMIYGLHTNNRALCAIALEKLDKYIEGLRSSALPQGDDDNG